VYDMPAVRRVVKDAARDGYRMQTLVAGIVKSYPFLYRRSETTVAASAAARP
jgi:hypothetical protein